MGIVKKTVKKGAHGVGKVAKKGVRGAKKRIRNYNKKRKSKKDRSHFED